MNKAFFFSQNIVPVVDGGGTDYDADAQAFIDAAGLSDTTQQNAVNNLVVDLKGNDLWPLMKAIYPFVGGNANAHKFNLISPNDTDASFRLNFVGSPIHDSKGVKFNGTSQHAISPLLTPASINNSNLHISAYSQTAYATSNVADIGCANQDGEESYTQINSSNWIIIDNTSRDGGFEPVAYNGAPSYIINSRVSSSTVLGIKNGAPIEGLISPINLRFSPSTLAFAFAAVNGVSNNIRNRSPKKYSFFTVGLSLTDEQCATLNTIVENFQIALDRGVQ